MRKRTHKRNKNMKVIAASVALLACAAGGGLAALNTLDTRTADRYGCFDGAAQRHTAALIDVSEPRWNGEQARSIRRYLERLYDSLAFNERLSVYTSEEDVMASVAVPRFSVCGQARTPEELKAVNAEGGSAGYFQKQRERLYEKVLAPELDALLSETPDDGRRQPFQSPILEMIADMSRTPTLGPGSRLVVISDLIQNSDSAQFCRVRGAMPPFSSFKGRSLYQRLKPRSLEGVEVEVLMVQRYGYGQGGLRYCYSEEELRRFWHDYLVDNGVQSPTFIRIRHGGTGE